MVLLTTTPQILDFISSLSAETVTTLASSSSGTLPTSTSCPISHDTLVALSRLRRSPVPHTSPHNDELRSQSKATPKTTRNATYSLNKLLRGTQVYIPPPPAKKAHTPEYIALMTRLRAEAEQRQYQNLISQQTDALLGQDTMEEQDPITPSLVINIFLSVVLTAVAVFIMSRWWSNEGMRVLLSLAVAIVVGVAEVVVYSGYVRNVKRSRLKQQLQKERKVVLGEYTGGEDKNVYDGTGAKIVVDRDAIERDVIWGKGKHGGMRRRVRERWEKEQNEQEKKQR